MSASLETRRPTASSPGPTVHRGVFEEKGIEMNKITTHRNSYSARLVLFTAVLLLGRVSFAEDIGAFLDGIRYPDHGVRMKARLSDPTHGASAIAGLG